MGYLSNATKTERIGQCIPEIFCAEHRISPLGMEGAITLFPETRGGIPVRTGAVPNVIAIDTSGIESDYHGTVVATTAIEYSAVGVRERRAFPHDWRYVD